MASYIQGVTDFIPQVQPWQPDYNFYSNVLERKQQKYDQGWQQTNSIYNSILNAPMMRQQNLNRRDEFFTNIKQDIEQMAKVDLSLAQNVDAAYQTFKPFYDDENIIKDITYTKKFQTEMQRAEYFRTCLDYEKCGNQYWEEGVRAMQYQAQDFINADDQSALGMSAPTYTPYVNFMELATKAVDEAGLNMTFDTVENGYMVTTKNGPQMQIPLMNFLSQRFGDDARLKGYYDTKAYLMLKENPEMANQMYQAQMQNPNINEQEAQEVAKQRVLSDTYDKSKQVVNVKHEVEENRFQTLVKKKYLYEKAIAEEGLQPGSEEERKYNQLVQETEIQGSVVSKYSELKKTINNIDVGIKNNGLVANEKQMQHVIGNVLQMQEIYSASSTLMFKDYSVTKKADQYALESFRHKNAVSLASMRNQWSLQQKGYDYFLKKGLKDKPEDFNIQSFLSNSSSTPAGNMFENLVNGVLPQGVAEQQADFIAMSLMSGMSNPSSFVSQNINAINREISNGNYGIVQQAIENEDVAVFKNNLNEKLREYAQQNLTEYKVEEIGLQTDARVDIVTTTGMDADIVIHHSKELLNEHNNNTAAHYKNAYAEKNNTDNSFNNAIWGDWIMKPLLKGSNDPDFDKAGVDLLAVGETVNTHIKNTFGRNFQLDSKSPSYNEDLKTLYGQYQKEQPYRKLPKLEEDEFKVLMDLPTNTKNVDKAYDSSYAVKLSNISIDKIVGAMGGQEAFEKHIINGQPIFSKDARVYGGDDTLIENPNNIISNSEAEAIRLKIEKENEARIKNPEFVDSSITEAHRNSLAQRDLLYSGADYVPGGDVFLNSKNYEKFASNPYNSKLYQDKQINDLYIQKIKDNNNEGYKEIQKRMPLTAGVTLGDNFFNLVVQNMLTEDPETGLVKVKNESQLNASIIQNLNKIPADVIRENAHKSGQSISSFMKEISVNGALDKIGILSVLENCIIDIPNDFNIIQPIIKTVSAAIYEKNSNQFESVDQVYQMGLQQLKILKGRAIHGNNKDINDILNSGNIEAQFNINKNDNAKRTGVNSTFTNGLMSFIKNYADEFELKQEGDKIAIVPNLEKWNAYKGELSQLTNVVQIDLNKTNVTQGLDELFTSSTSQQQQANVYRTVVEKLNNQKSALGDGTFNYGLKKGEILVDFSNPEKNKFNILEVHNIMKSGMENGNFENLDDKNLLMSLNKMFFESKVKSGEEIFFKVNVLPNHKEYGTTTYEIDLNYHTKFADKFKAYNRDAETKIPLKQFQDSTEKHKFRNITFDVKDAEDQFTKNHKYEKIAETIHYMKDGEEVVIPQLKEEQGGITITKHNRNNVALTYQYPIWVRKDNKMVQEMETVTYPSLYQDFSNFPLAVAEVQNIIYENNLIFNEQMNILKKYNSNR